MLSDIGKIAVPFSQLFKGALIVIGFEILRLINISIFGLGSIWPIAILWAICCWAPLGPNISTASVIFLLGLFLDAVAGTPLGIWALVYLTNFSIMIFVLRFMGKSSFNQYLNITVASFVMVVSTLFVGLVTDHVPNLKQLIIPLFVTIILFPYFSGYFIVDDEASS